MAETGVYRPGAGFYLKMDNGSAWNPTTDMYLAWDNAANDRPVAGDWNSDGRTETGVYRPGTGFYLKMDNGSAWNPTTDMYLAWDNAANDRPVAGDWNSDGRTETGVYRPGAGFYLKIDNNSIWAPSSDVYLAWDNAANDLPVAVSLPQIQIVAPTAAFSSDVQSGYAPLTVRFTDQSINTPTSWKWEYQANGTSTWTEFGSGAQNTSFSFPAGIYDIRLTATNAGGSAIKAETQYITSSIPAPLAAFSSDVQSGYAPLTARFTDQSINTPTSWKWEYQANGTSTWTEFGSGAQNTSFSFPAGIYNIRLTATNAGGSAIKIETQYITSSITAPTAAFISDVQSGDAPLIVRFTDQSANIPTSWKWKYRITGTSTWTAFGSDARNPSFSFTAGTYDIQLTVTNDIGTDTKTKAEYISVTESPEAPSAAFIANKVSGYAPLTVRFTDQSTGSEPLRYAWDFNNDGSTDSTAQNPSFTYSTIGTFTVKLKVTNDVGSDTTTKSNFITVSENQSGGSHAGIALTFDDDTVDAWYATREILQRYNAHVTFFVSNLGGLDQSEINELKLLQADGNEIAFHGYNHEDQEEYLQNHTLDDYMNNEIIRGVNLMKSWGLNPMDFAYPFGHDDPATTQALEGYFGHMRDTSYDWEDPSIYYQYGSNQAYISGMGIDDNTYNQSLDINNIYTGISQAKTDHKILIFYGHKTVASNPAEYETSYDRLEKILQYASNNSMKTYTISEIH